MRNKALSKRLICILTVIIMLVNTGIVMADNNDAVSEAQSLADGIVAFKLNEAGAKNIQEWIDGELAGNAGTLSEWYIITLSQRGKYDFRSYADSLKKYLNNNETSSPVTCQKYALALAASGTEAEYINDIFDNTIGKLGIMSWIYGLHLLNNGYTSKQYTKEDVISNILLLQLDDGGFAINGRYGDVDVTAMTVQALAPHYKSDENVKKSIDLALELLSQRQLDDGGFSSYGVANPESASQVIVALSALDIDFAKDTRFIKNENTILDFIKKYRTSDGAYCHNEGTNTSENATIQVFYALTSYIRMAEGKSPLYILDKNQPQNDDETAHEKTGDYKLPVCIIIAALGMAASIVLIIAKKRHRNNYIFIWMIVAILIGIVCLTDIKSSDEYYNGKSEAKKNIVGEVTFSIKCNNIAGKSDSKYIPDDGIILKEATFKIEKGDTVYDILCEAARQYKIQFEAEGKNELAYIRGINYIYEFDFGDLSGWMYFVNGREPSVGCGSYELSDGDVIVWNYTCNLGEDLR